MAIPGYICSRLYLMVSGVLRAGSKDIHCDLWEAGNGGRRSRRRGKALLGLGCLADVAACCGYTASSKMSLGVFVLGKALPCLCVPWTSLALKIRGRVHDFWGEVGREELLKLTVLYKIP